MAGIESNRTEHQKSLSLGQQHIILVTHNWLFLSLCLIYFSPSTSFQSLSLTCLFLLLPHLLPLFTHNAHDPQLPYSFTPGSKLTPFTNFSIIDSIPRTSLHVLDRFFRASCLLIHTFIHYSCFLVPCGFWAQKYSLSYCIVWYRIPSHL